MELEGAKRSFHFLSIMGLPIRTFISDRHRGIAKWIRECQPNTRHFFDIWHIARSIGKAMLKASKFVGCDRIKDWMKAVRNHLYWSATSTALGFEEMIVAKWKTVVQHIANRHVDHPDPLFKVCAHGEYIEKRKWIKIGWYKTCSTGSIIPITQAREQHIFCHSTQTLCTVCCKSTGTAAYQNFRRC